MVLPITDGAWLLIESREAPQHVGGLMLFDYPDDADDTWLHQLWQRLRTATNFQSPFGDRMRWPYGRAGLFDWEPDPNVDLDYHLRFSALPRPGRVRELLVLVSRLHSTLLDRHRPLWEIHLIEGLMPDADDGPGARPRFAIYAKFHHSMFDGVGAMRVLREMFSPDPARRNMPAPWEISTAAPTTPQPSVVEVERSRKVDLLGPVKSVGTVAGALRDQLSATKAGEEGEVMPFSAPKSLLNGRITGSRRFAADGFAFDRMAAVAKGLDVSLNDVALAMSSSMLRTYLLDHGALPDRPLTGMIPVSVRSEQEASGGNAISFLVTDLGTDLADPAERLGRITTSMAKGKARLASMSRSEMIGYAVAITSPYVIGPLLGIAGRGRPLANVVISNVPGPRQPVYFDGARLRGMYPASLLQQGQALNITLTSYDTEMQFGLTACRQTLPHMQRMLDHLDAGLRELEKLAGL